MSTNTNKVTESTKSAKKDKVILRKPAGNKDGNGWAGEVIRVDGRREFVPEMFKETWTDQELAMTKIGNLVKAIADCTNYAAKYNLDYSGIIAKWGVDCLQQWDAYTSAVKARKDARDALTGTKDEVKEKWEEIKGPYNSRVRTQFLKMELLTEQILAGEPKKVLK